MSVFFFGPSELANLLARLPAATRPMAARHLAEVSRANAAAFRAQYRRDADPVTVEQLLALAQDRIGDAALARQTAMLLDYNTVTNGDVRYLSPTSPAYAFVHALRARLEAEAGESPTDEPLTREQRLRRQLGATARCALDIQDACNLSGVVQAFAKAMLVVWAEARAHELGTDWVNRHPIALAFASKVASLTGCDETRALGDALDFCAAAAAALSPRDAAPLGDGTATRIP